MKYKIMIDYTKFIPIDETELEKALTAFSTGQPAIFNEGATDRVNNVLPDYHKMLGYNYGYKLQPEDWKEINTSKECQSAKRLIEDTKLKLAGGAPRSKEISAGVKQLAAKMKGE